MLDSVTSVTYGQVPAKMLNFEGGMENFDFSSDDELDESGEMEQDEVDGGYADKI